LNESCSSSHDHIVPNVLNWLIIALIFIALGILVIRGRASRRMAMFQIALLGVLCSASIAFLDFWRSFAEAFSTGIDHYLAPIHFELTFVTFLFGIYFVWRRRRPPTDAFLSQ